MRTDPVIARLAAANPVPQPAPHASPASGFRPGRRTLVVALAAAIALPALAFADDIGGLFGFSSKGQPVATSATAFSETSGLNQAMAELGFPATLRLIATRAGIDFYAARRADGHFCFAVDTAPGQVAHKAVGCDLGNPSLQGNPSFPSPQRPIIDFSRFSGRLAGFAADGVSVVNLLGSSGKVLASAPVSENVYATADPQAGGAAVEALDSNGAVIYKRSFGQAP